MLIELKIVSTFKQHDSTADLVVNVIVEHRPTLVT